MNVSPNILAENQHLKKLRHGSVDERALITTTLIWKSVVPYCLRKKGPENAFLTLMVDYRKILQQKQIMLFKTIAYWLFNDI